MAKVSKEMVFTPEEGEGADGDDGALKDTDEATGVEAPTTGVEDI